MTQDENQQAIRFGRVFAMPSADTLSIKPIRKWTEEKIYGISVDPFARNCKLATITNDLSPETSADFHMDAADFCDFLASRGYLFDCAIFDPPYSPRQISECYKSVGLEVGMAGTQNAALYKRVRDALDPLIKPGGIVLSYGWNSSGMGLKRNYAPFDILLVQHGGAHNDTICLAERKRAT